MRNRKRSGLLGKRKRKFPDQNDGRIYKNRERAVLEFTRKIAADPGIGAQNRPLPLRPTARHIGEHRQDRQFIVSPFRRFTETPYKTTGFPSVITRTFCSRPCSRAAASNRCGGSCSGSKPRRNVP